MEHCLRRPNDLRPLTTIPETELPNLEVTSLVKGTRGRIVGVEWGGSTRCLKHDEYHGATITIRWLSGKVSIVPHCDTDSIVLAIDI